MSDMPTTTLAPELYRSELTALLGGARVIPPGKKISRYLRDFSWYSPILENALSDTAIEAVALPQSLDELRGVVALAARHRVPFTLRGAGTGNYGQSLPLQPGIVIDVRGVAGVLDIAEGRVVVLPGTIMKHVETAVHEHGQELAVMPSTFRVATASGFIAGGSGGLGAAAHGDIWNGNILAVELLTVEEEPRLLRLEGDDVSAVLHTYGTVGVITQIEFRLVPARVYAAVCVSFAEFEQCARFGWEVIAADDIHARLDSLHQAPLGSMMTPIADLYPADASVALIWVDGADESALTALAARHGGTTTPWPEGVKDITQFPFSHSVLWSKRAEPSSSWLQCEYANGDLDAFLAQVDAISARFPGVFLQHIEMVTSSSGEPRPLGISALVGLPDYEDSLTELMDFSRSIGMIVMNPHSFVVDEGGFVGDVDRLIELKAESDPYGILNPGKLGASFFASRQIIATAAQREATEREVVAPEAMASS